MTAIASNPSKGPDLYSLTKKLEGMSDASASKLFGISVADYQRLGASGAASYYQNQLGRFGLDQAA